MGRPKGAADPRGPRVLTGQARQARAVELRIQGWTYEQIRAELGYASRGSVHEAITGLLKRRERPLADDLAKIHLAQLDLAIRPVMDQVQAHIDGTRRMSAKQAGVVTLALTRNLAAQARYVDVYSSAQGMGPVVSLLERLLEAPPADDQDPDDPMTVTDSVLNTPD